jgi:hypothetical protein
LARSHDFLRFYFLKRESAYKKDWRSHDEFREDACNL